MKAIGLFPAHPYIDVAPALSQHPSDEIKAVIEWGAV